MIEGRVERTKALGPEKIAMASDLQISGSAFGSVFYLESMIALTTS